METSFLKLSEYEEMKALFLDVFSREPWFDKWKDEKQVDLYLKDLIDNKNSLSLVFFDENKKLVGGSLGYVFNWWEGREYFIKEFFVSKEKQNQGIGSMFLTQISDILKGEEIKHIWLATERTVSAYHFYHKNGFTELKDSAFLMKKVFNDNG
ncbi:GNAT family N-acetyltransferase [Amphibacillus sediminis]|uniref:GNAT family N-acetyltransferase n=1 Tax=Amphibacillus sediminis TaxID=360185 RepID=UPI0008327DDE|nr:GNAT family N-acetyltransferase [Amphibacillus sediminis]